LSGTAAVPVILATTARIRGGVWRHIADLAGGLQELGLEVSVALEPDALDIRRAAAERGLRVRALAASVRVRRAIWHAHLHDTYDRRLAAAVIVRRALGPTVITEHLPRSNASDAALLPGPRHPLAAPAKTAFKRTQYAAADAVIALSPSSAAFLAERYGWTRAAVVPNGLPPRPGTGPVDAATTAQPTAASGGPVHVITVGSVIDQKGHDVLVAAAARAAGGWRATVIGDGPDRPGLAARADRQGLPVAFAGWREDVEAELDRAAVACLPSRWESAPYAALEAMRAGLPLVASDVDGLRDLVQDGVNGVLVPPEDPAALAGALDRLAAMPELRTRLGAAARVRAAEFTSDRMARETAAVYGSAVARRSRS
jgi:glycosyltransferase involved in cell wall biosynthesis